MKDLEDIKKEVEPGLTRLNETILEHLNSPNELLNTISSFFVEKRGKQIRAILTLLIAKLSGTPNKKTIDGGASIEMLHNASLIHDDVVDNSERRRNRESINKIWGNQVAVLVGDFFITTGSNLAVSTGDLRIVESINKLGRQLTIGELDQIYNAQHNLLDENAYIRMVERKTASLFESCAEIACYSVNADDKFRKDVTEFARLMGICFQIKDDIFDYYSELSNKLGKPVGNDLIEGKISLPLLHVLIKDKNEGRKDRIDICFKEDKTVEEIDYLINAAIDEGGIEYANKKMEELYLEAEKTISDFPSSDIKDSLLSLFRYVIERTH